MLIVQISSHHYSIGNHSEQSSTVISLACHMWHPSQLPRLFAWQDWRDWRNFPRTGSRCHSNLTVLCISNVMYTSIIYPYLNLEPYLCLWECERACRCVGMSSCTFHCLYILSLFAFVSMSTFVAIFVAICQYDKCTCSICIDICNSASKSIMWVFVFFYHFCLHLS